jgi:hypothetical protein
VNFADLREQLMERLQTLWAQIQESSAYNDLQERYESLSPRGQKMTIVGVVAVVLLLIAALPWSYFDSSSNHIAEFESKRELTRQLLRVTRSSNEPPLEHITGLDLRNRVDAELKVFNLQSTQILSIQEMNAESMKNLKLAPSPIQEDGVEVRLGKLNLRQMVDIGFRLQSMSEMVKMSGLVIRANKDDNHYFDVTFQLASFSVPTAPAPTNAGAKKGRK